MLLAGWTARGDDAGAKFATAGATVDGLKPGVSTIVFEGQPIDLGAEQRPNLWAGPRKDTRIEVTLTGEGGTSIRYLPAPRTPRLARPTGTSPSPPTSRSTASRR